MIVVHYKHGKQSRIKKKTQVGEKGKHENKIRRERKRKIREKYGKLLVIF